MTPIEKLEMAEILLKNVSHCPHCDSCKAAATLYFSTIAHATVDSTRDKPPEPPKK